MIEYSISLSNNAELEAFRSIDKNSDGVITSLEVKQKFGEDKSKIRKKLAEMGIKRDELKSYIIKLYNSSIGKIKYISEHSLEILKDNLNDTNAGTRKHAAEALNRFGSAATPILAERLTNEKDREIKITIIESLGKIGYANSATLLAMAKELKNSDDVLIMFILLTSKNLYASNFTSITKDKRALIEISKHIKSIILEMDGRPSSKAGPFSPSKVLGIGVPLTDEDLPGLFDTEAIKSLAYEYLSLIE